MTLWITLPALAGTAFFLTWLLRRYAVARSLMDIPNERSSHTVPTPRGGGVAIVLTFLAAVMVLAFLGLMEKPSALGLIGAGALVAVVGFMDDHRHIAARWRLLAHFLGAAWILYWMQGLPTLVLFGIALNLGWVGYGLVALLLVWLLNLYNFMDGIDGIAGIEAVTVGIGGALLYSLVGQGAMAIAPLALAAVVAGFLYWNFPPAKIFMGDAGSGFLGIVIGGLTLQAAWIEPQLFWGWLILLGVFVVDATFTLIRRLLRGDKVYEAHRSHAYQFASRKLGAHLPVSLAVLTINIIWLLPCACAVALGYVDGALGLLIAYVPLVLLVARFKAGEIEVLL